MLVVIMQIPGAPAAVLAKSEAHVNTLVTMWVHRAVMGRLVEISPPPGKHALIGIFGESALSPSERSGADVSIKYACLSAPVVLRAAQEAGILGYDCHFAVHKLDCQPAHEQLGAWGNERSFTLNVPTMSHPLRRPGRSIHGIVDVNSHEVDTVAFGVLESMAQYGVSLLDAVIISRWPIIQLGGGTDAGETLPGRLKLVLDQIREIVTIEWKAKTIDEARTLIGQNARCPVVLAAGAVCEGEDAEAQWADVQGWIDAMERCTPEAIDEVIDLMSIEPDVFVPLNEGFVGLVTDLISIELLNAELADGRRAALLHALMQLTA